MVKLIYYRGASFNDILNETEKEVVDLSTQKPMSKRGALFNDAISGELWRDHGQYMHNTKTCIYFSKVW
jgi:hypothetical protein